MTEINLQAFADGEDINRVLNPAGFKVDIITQELVNQAARNIRFLMSLNFMTHEEGQTVFKRVLDFICKQAREYSDG